MSQAPLEAALIDPNLTFASFVVAPSNRLAADAARRVSELPAAAYNPLVIAGSEGSGKTHLLHAIAHEARALRTMEEPLLFTAADSPDAPAGPLLLIDDLHLIAGSHERQSALVSACRAAVTSGTQVVLACRTPLTAFLNGEVEELVGEGLLVELEPPDFELAAAVVNRFAGELDLSLAREAADELASRSFTPGKIRASLTTLREERGGGAEISIADILRLLDGPPAAAPTAFDEFGSFLEDVSTVIAVAVESVPWRKILSEAIHRWESAGIRTDRLENALEADFPDDVERLVAEFERDARRLVDVRAELGEAAVGYVLDDPDRLAEVEALFASWKAAAEAARPAAHTPVEVFRTVDPWFLDPDRLVLSAFDIEGRIPGDRR